MSRLSSVAVAPLKNCRTEPLLVGVAGMESQTKMADPCSFCPAMATADTVRVIAMAATVTSRRVIIGFSSRLGVDRVRPALGTRTHCVGLVVVAESLVQRVPIQ